MTAQSTPVNVFFVADDGFAPYLAVTMQSLRAHAAADRPYRLAVIGDGFSPENAARLAACACGDDPRFTLEFLQVDPAALGLADIAFHGHFGLQTYYRLLAPELIPHWDKAVFLDADTVVLADVAELFDRDLTGCLLAAIHDVGTAGLYNGADPTWQSYQDDTLGLADPYGYFQAGVLLMNLDLFRTTFRTADLLDYARTHDLRLFDQDLLNVFCQGRVQVVPMTWNVLMDNEGTRIRTIIVHAPERLQRAYFKARLHPRVVHYAGPEKPWLQPGADMARFFWEHALNTPYGEALWAPFRHLEESLRAHWDRERITTAILRWLPWQLYRRIRLR